MLYIVRLDMRHPENGRIVMLELVYQHCIGKAGATEGFPFDEDTLVLKVGGKMFALISLEKSPLWISLKCDPERAVELRESYASVQPGYHLSKIHWNSIVLDGELSDKLVIELIDHSYNLIRSSLTAKIRKALDDGTFGDST